MAGFSFLSQLLPTALSVAATAGKTMQNQRETNQAVQYQQEQQRIASEKETASRQDALRRAVARQRASFGAQGISSDDGSAEAILLGLTQQSNTEQSQQDALDRLRTQALQDSAASKQRKNLLQLNQSYDTARLSSLFSD